MAATVELVVTAVDQASNILGNITGKLMGLAKIGFAALAAGIAGATAAVASFMKEAAAAELVSAKFNSVIDSSRLADYKGELLGIADALSKVTRFDDEAIMSAETQLALYENIGEDIFPQVIALSLDLAEAMGTDAASGAETLGRALADIAEGSLALLYRQKLITKEQQEMATAMAATGDEAGAQAYILDILDGKIGDLAETMGKTWSGQIEILKNNVGNLKEGIGALFTEALAPLLATFNDLVTKYGPAVVSWFETKIIPAVQSLVSAIQGLLTGKTNLADFLQNLFGGGQDAGLDFVQMILDKLKQIDWSAVGETVLAAFEAIDWNRLGSLIGQGLIIMRDAIQQIDWSQMLSGVGKAFMDFSTGIGGGTTEQFVADWTNGLQGMANLFTNIFYTLGQKIGSIIVMMRTKVKEFISIGRAIVTGLQLGIELAWVSFVTWLTAKIMDIVDTVLDALGIQSPSKVFANIGKQMMAGMAVGVAGGVAMPVSALQSAIPQVTKAAMGGNTSNQHYYYGAKIMLEQGREGEILSTLTM